MQEGDTAADQARYWGHREILAVLEKVRVEISP